MAAWDSQSDVGLNTHIHDACARFDINIRDNVISLTNTLEAIAKNLAQSHELRQQLGIDDPSVWPELRKLWRDLARAQLTFWDHDDLEEEDAEDGEKMKQQSLRTMCTSLAKFTRNIVAEVPKNQAQAFEYEVDIRRLLHYHTSWSAIKDEETFPVTRMLAQTLSNVVTGNEDLMTRLWDTYMNLPEDQVVLIRLLASPDARTVLAVLVLILNCIHGNKARARMLCATRIGIRVCISFLDDMVSLYDAEESSDGARAFDVGYDIFTHIIEGGLVPDLYTKLSIQDEIITPHQTTLLKLVDSYLQSMQINVTITTPKTKKIHKKLSPMLAKCFFALSAYAQRAIRRSLGSSTSGVSHPTADPSTANASPSTCNPTSAEHLHHEPEAVELSRASLPPTPTELDIMLPKVCEALVLVTQCIVTITLEAEDQDGSPVHDTDQNRDPSTWTIKSGQNLKQFFNATRSSEQGIVESLIELLRLLDQFLPRINFGKPVPSPSRPAQNIPTNTPQQMDADPTGFSYLKRDLVRLLGILCHGAKAVQDLVRVCGGIQIVMNLCVVDERNPYLREHAIFTLHNLLKDNAENQAVVDETKPMGEWDEDGVLRDVPGSIRR